MTEPWEGLEEKVEAYAEQQVKELAKIYAQGGGVTIIDDIIKNEVTKYIKEVVPFFSYKEISKGKLGIHFGHEIVLDINYEIKDFINDYPDHDELKLFKRALQNGIKLIDIELAKDE